MLSAQAPAELQGDTGMIPSEVISAWEMPAGANIFAEPDLAVNPVIESAGEVSLAYVDATGHLFVLEWSEWMPGFPGPIQILQRFEITFGGAPIDFHAFKAAGWEAVAADIIEGVRSLTWRHSSGHLHFWQLSAGWAHESSVGWVAPYSTAYFATEVSFGVDFNGDGVLGGTLISNCGVPLYHDDAGRLIADGCVITAGGEVDYHAFQAAGWEAVAVCDSDGVNSLVWRHSSGHLHFWRLSAAWALSSSDGWIAPGSDEYYDVEVACGCDLNDDGLIGGPNVIGDCGVRGVPLAQDSSGRLFADFCGTQRFTMITSGGPIDYHAFKAAGWEALAVQPVPDGVYRLIAPTHVLVWRHSSGHLHFWGLWSSGEHVQSWGWVAPGSEEYYDVEVDWGCDFNDDGLVGRPNVIEQCNAVTLAHDGAGRLVAGIDDIDGRQRFAMITVNGGPVDYHAFQAAGWEAVAAEVIRGVNSLAWRHSSGHLHFWRLSAAWALASSDGWIALGSDEYSDVEVAWGCDFNGDGVIGDPIAPFGSSLTTVLGSNPLGTAS
jgi:hypothetical protein